MTIPGRDRKIGSPIEFGADPRSVFGAVSRSPDQHRARPAPRWRGSARTSQTAPISRAHRIGTSPRSDDDDGSEPRLRRHRERSDVGQPEREAGAGGGDLDGAREPALPGPMGDPDHGRHPGNAKIAGATFSGGPGVMDAYPHIIMDQRRRRRRGSTSSGMLLLQALINDVIRHRRS